MQGSAIIGKYNPLGRHLQRIGAPPVSDNPVALHQNASLDKEVYDWLMKYGKGYPTRINQRLLRADTSRIAVWGA
jgi:uncharacterized protein (DUF4415 family)